MDLDEPAQSSGVAPMTVNFGDLSHLQPGDLWGATGQPLTTIAPGRYRLTAEYLYFEKGALRTNAQQIPTRGIVDVDMKQSMIQKTRKLATAMVHVVRPTGQRETVELEDIPNFRDGVEIINRVARDARENYLRLQNTQHVNYQGSPVLGGVAPSAVSDTSSRGSQELETLRQVVGMHDREVLDDVAFIAEVKRVVGGSSVA